MPPHFMMSRINYHTQKLYNGDSAIIMSIAMFVVDTLLYYYLEVTTFNRHLWEDANKIKIVSAMK